MTSLQEFLRKLFPGLRPSPQREERSGKGLPHWEMLAEDHEEQQTENGGTVWKPMDAHFWKDHLKRDEYDILFQHGTERAGTSTYNKFYPRKGHFACRACGLPIYSAKTKFDSGTGWPSFGGHIEGNVQTKVDFSPMLGKRIELHCRRCHGHLGHVFADKHPMRYNPGKYHKERQCINGRSIYYVADALPAETNYEATSLSQS